MIRHALNYTKAYLGKYIKNEKGQAMVEYGILVALIAAVVIIAVTPLGGLIKTAFTTIVEELGGTVPTT